MTTATRTAEACTYRVDPSSLVATDRSLVIDGAGDDKACSIHLVFDESGSDSVELFHCGDCEDEVLAINGVLHSKLLVPLIAQVIEHRVITLKVLDTDENVPLRSVVPETLDAFRSTKSA